MDIADPDDLRSLCSAIVEQAIVDLGDRRDTIRADAQLFFSDGDFNLFAEPLAGIDADACRSRLQRDGRLPAPPP